MSRSTRRTERSSSMPSPSGMWMSLRITSIRFAASSASAACPVSTSMTSNAARRNNRDNILRSDEPTLATPAPIFDAAIQLGRLSALGRRIRHLAGRTIAGSEIPTLFINLHPQDLLDVDLVDERSPLTQIATRVVLEVTERESLVTSAALTERLERLRQLGFRLAIDDIGAGYSGLTSFTDLTPEIVKIDMSLVRSIHTSRVKQRTVGALCTLCHEIGTLVVGEGVETEDEQACLIELGCDLLQGYLIARPNRELPKV